MMKMQSSQPSHKTVPPTRKYKQSRKGKVENISGNATLIRNKWGIIDLRKPIKSNGKLGRRKSGIAIKDLDNEGLQIEREKHLRGAGQGSHDHSVVD